MTFQTRRVRDLVEPVRQRLRSHPNGSNNTACRADPSRAGVLGGLPADRTSGIMRVKKSATMVIRASTARLNRNPAMRASSFSSTIASTCFGGSPTSSRAAFRGLRRGRNGNSPLELNSACAVTSDGTSGLSAMPWRKDALSTAIRIDPASAVPRDAPRLVRCSAVRRLHR